MVSAYDQHGQFRRNPDGSLPHVGLNDDRLRGARAAYGIRTDWQMDAATRARVEDELHRLTEQAMAGPPGPIRTRATAGTARPKVYGQRDYGQLVETEVVR